ncbi:lmo0937 family membrane protein [Flavobacterium terrisoli]|uniref:lmo0937 family membrane protein n=1 Tax=Flavobacterium terrisoli TaxID=3242195 RepID=UPI002542F2D3|nr:lmo0937 family membrane protein [Flavobacterium buctense]
MQNLLYTIAVVLIVLWVFGFLVYNVGAIIHILLLIAVVAVLLKVIKGKEI